MIGDPENFFDAVAGQAVKNCVELSQRRDGSGNRQAQMKEKPPVVQGETAGLNWISME